MTEKVGKRVKRGQQGGVLIRKMARWGGEEGGVQESGKELNIHNEACWRTWRSDGQTGRQRGIKRERFQ